MKQVPFHRFSQAFDLDSLSRLPKIFRIVISIDGVGLLNIVSKRKAFLLPKADVITFHADETSIAFIGVVEDGCFHSTDGLQGMSTTIILG